MKALFFLFSFSLATGTINAQFQDDFNNGTFPDDPLWLGDTGIYSVNASNELQLMDTIGGESFVYANVNTADSTGWEFYFRMEFDPSTSNWLKVYLTSDNPDLDGNLNGYFLKIGAANEEDAIELYRQDGNDETLIFSGAAGAVASEPSVKVRMTRDAGGLWQLFADYSGGDNLVLDGSGTDNTYTSGNYFGLQCNYSPTRKDKFFFDDILIGPTVLDETPPVLLSASPVNNNILLATFDEALDQNTAENTGNYSIDNGIIVNNASLDSDPSRVVLSISSLSNGQDYQLTSSGVADLAGNIASGGTVDFAYFVPEPAEPFDILINEVYFKPDPQVSNLPDAEFFELYNRSTKTIDLDGFVISDAANSKTLPAYLMPPQSYLIICNSTDLINYLSYGPVIGVSGLFGLNDSGDDLSIADNFGTLLHMISYNNDWYQEDNKTGGGWSIEMVNPGLYCQGAGNWRASVSAQGGTPGQQNSVFDNSPDLVAPSLLNAIPVSQNKLRLFFDEIMNDNAEMVTAYNIPNAGNIIAAHLETPGLNTVLLTIEAPFFVDQQMYTIIADPDISDCSGNPIGAANAVDFTYFLTQPADRYDILINEIFPDPSPAIGLPEAEFIELYNRSDKVIDLEGFSLLVGGDEFTMPFFLLLPDSYLIIQGNDGPDFSAYGEVLVVNGNLELANAGDQLELLSPEGTSIHAIDYTSDWYRDNSKNDGGWTLELINPHAPCAFASNWRAAVNANGGTPGTSNSVLDNTEDTDSPDLIKAFPLSSTLIELTFNKALDEISSGNPDNYTVDGFSVVDVSLIPPFYNQLTIVLDAPIEDGEVYDVIVSSEVSDCIGNSIGLFNTARFGLPQEMEEEDLVINEILVNPESGGVRFVEMYNRSSKVLNINDLIVATRNLDDNEIERPFPVETDCLLFPGDYLVLTPSPADIKESYYAENPNAFIVNGLPSYDDKEGVVVLYVPQILGARIIDEFQYSEAYHNSLLDDKNGVSLERINPDRPTNEAGNWHSAAESVGFATPTYQNSQFMNASGSAEDFFSISVPRLSPDGDGFEDFLLINYKSDSPGYLANIRIFDAKGRLIKTLTDNELLAAEGNFKWDGSADNGEKARIGIYVVWIELFHPEGDVRHFKKTCVVAGILD